MARHRFEYASQLPVSAAHAFAWHDRPGAFDRLNPPWDPVTVVQRSDGIRDGAQVTIRVPVGPFGVRWHLEHRGWIEGRVFEDVQRSGPFRHWHHVHAFEPVADDACRLVDQIDFTPPLGPLLVPMTRSKLERLFPYRHRVTAGDLAAHARFADRPRLTVGISGASGLLGDALVHYLSTGGHRVKRLVRRPARHDAEIAWSVDGGLADPAALAGVDAIVHLAGENIAGGRWTDDRKKRIRDSRVDGTRALAESLARSATPPAGLIVASAVGYYGDRGAETLTETSASGDNFLAAVCRAWEEAAAPAREAGIRVVHARFGVILSPRGGALPKMLAPARLGVSAQVGSGEQFVSWIGLDDAVTALGFALLNPAIEGVVNLTAPTPVTNRDFARTLAKTLKRPALGRLPAVVARAALGEMADELLLASARVEPAALTQAGYDFRDPDLATALA
ncbi:MAG: TIGR01777 family oxidoreductase, partial [Phycisphaerae bacterium]|nr:TIGR01777 family oxidoreductase [Phycisphaerae bacterium]